MQTERFSMPSDREPMAWRIYERPGEVIVALVGEIDENADFAELGRLLPQTGRLVFDLGGIGGINSCGVREWVNFVRELDAGLEIALVACSSAIVTQLNMIYNFRGPARVLSFLAPYVCLVCAYEVDQLLKAADHFSDANRAPPVLSCPVCSGRMEFDELPERYLAFLNDT